MEKSFNQRRSSKSAGESRDGSVHAVGIVALCGTVRVLFGGVRWPTCGRESREGVGLGEITNGGT